MKIDTEPADLTAPDGELECPRFPPKPPSKDLVYDGARTLLLKAFNRSPSKTPLVHQLQAQHALHLLKSPIGRDFTLVTTAGPEFKMHSIMLTGGPRSLEEWLFPGGEPQKNPPTSLTLPPHCHPILVDRLINFLYTSDYDDPPFGGLIWSGTNKCNFTNATFVPTTHPPIPELTVCADNPLHIFRVHMYALGEHLRYHALMVVAREKLWDSLSNALTPTCAVKSLGQLKDCVEACFSPPGLDTKVCKDEDGALQQLIVTAALTHELKLWDATMKNSFTASLQKPEYKAFWSLYSQIKKENSEMLESLTGARQEKLEHKRARKEENEQMKTRSHQSAEAQSILGFKPPVNLLGSAPAAASKFPEQIQTAQNRRNNKTRSRKARAQTAEATLVANVDVFNSIDKDKAMANLAGLMGRSPAQIQNVRALQAMGQGNDAQLKVESLPFPANFTYTGGFVGMQQGHRGEAEGFEEGHHNLERIYKTQEVDVEMQNGMTRMRIDGDA